MIGRSEFNDQWTTTFDQDPNRFFVFSTVGKQSHSGLPLSTTFGRVRVLGIFRKYHYRWQLCKTTRDGLQIQSDPAKMLW